MNLRARCSLLLALAALAARAEDDFARAESLRKAGLGYGAFFHQAQVIGEGPSHPRFFEALAEAAAIAEESGDELVAPSVFDRVDRAQLRRLPPEALGRVASMLALLDYRAGKLDEAEQLLALAPKAPQPRYLAGLVQQRKDPGQAEQTFRALAADERAPRELRELAHLALGRVLYGMRRYREASAEYGKLPRFSRHWDEALFEGAYADLQAEDPGAALGRLQSLHSPHLSDEFAPESQNLAAIVYQRRCLYPQAREAIATFDRIYLPIRKQVERVLQDTPPMEMFWQMLEPGDHRLPSPVQRHLAKNERVAAMVGLLQRLKREEQQLRSGALSSTAEGKDLLELYARHEELVAQLAGKFIRGRLADLAHLVEVLDADKEIIRFEVTKGEKEMLEARFDARGQLQGQPLLRPPMPGSGYEYWPFDGEYWPDEIGYYQVTLKDACPARREE